MKVFILLVLAATFAQGKVIGSVGYEAAYDAPSSDYSESGDAHGSSGADFETVCKPFFETVKVDRCEHYREKVCYTTQQESCKDVEDKNCRAIVSSKQVRQCFNVTELLCGLKESIQYDIIQAVFTVQKCHTVNERVCDTVYEPQFTAKDDFQCIMLRNPKCHPADRTVIDKTCRTVTNFNCKSTGSMIGYGSSGDSYGNSGDSYGSGGDSYGNSGDSYGSSSDSYGNSDDSYVSGGDSYSSGSSGSGYSTESSDSGLGGGDSGCTKTFDTKCYTTPRTVTSQQCEDREEKVCEKLNERVPLPSERQVCHNEEKKVCELEQRQQPKQIKKYVYTKQCRSHPRRVCENADVKSLVPSCVPITRKQCHYTPVEKCEHIPKQHCHQVIKRVKKQKCDTVRKQSGYSSEASYSDDYSS